MVLTQGTNNVEQLPALLQPGHWIRCSLQVADDPFAINHHRGGSLDDDQRFFQIEAMIYGAIEISEHRKWRFEGFRVPASSFGRISQNHEYLGAGGLKVLVHSPQLGDVRAALHSVIFAHEEQDNVRLSFVFRQTNFLTGACHQFEIRRGRTCIQFSIHFAAMNNRLF